MTAMQDGRDLPALRRDATGRPYDPTGHCPAPLPVLLMIALLEPWAAFFRAVRDITQGTQQ